MPKKFFDLAAGDQQCRAGGKADHHGMGDEIDQHAHARQPQNQLEQAGKEGQGQHHADELRRAGFGQDVRIDGEYGDGNRGGRPGNQMPAGAEQGGDDGRHHRGIEAVFGRHAGDGGKGHALRQHDHGAGELPADHRAGVSVTIGHQRRKGRNRRSASGSFRDVGILGIDYRTIDFQRGDSWCLYMARLSRKGFQRQLHLSVAQPLLAK